MGALSTFAACSNEVPSALDDSNEGPSTLDDGSVDDENNKKIKNHMW